MNVVVDGNNFESFIFKCLLKERVGEVFSYQGAYDFTMDFLIALKECNLVIKRIYLDVVEDPFVVDDKVRRHKQRLKGNGIIRSVLLKKPKTPFYVKEGAMFGTTMVCRSGIRAAVTTYFHNVPDIYYVGGKTCHR